MKNKNNIEQIFQKELKDFEASPPPESWELISEKLQKKRKKRIVPVFWINAIAFSTAAALLILGVFWLRDYKKPNETPTLSNSIQSNDEKIDSSMLKPTLDQAFSKGNKNKFVSKEAENQSAFPKNQLVKNGIQKKDINNETSITPKDNVQDENIAIKADNNEDNFVLAQKNEDDKKEVVEGITTKQDNVLGLTGTNKKDTIVLAKKETQEEGVLKEKIDKEIKKTKHEKKFFISPFAAPIFAFSNGGSPIAAQFNDNINTFNTNISYGINAGYSLGNKLKLRSGLHYVNLNNRTDNIIFEESSASSQSIANIKLNENASDIVLLSGNSDYQTSEPTQVYQSGSILQKTSFLEVPLELSYALYSKKITINAVTGFSAYILDKNKVYLSTSSGDTEIGKLNNINRIHYSGNLGFNFQYLLGKNYNFFIEPVVKYQFNTYESETTDSKPYFIGIYTGFVYSF